jgi:hypothetical protein
VDERLHGLFSKRGSYMSVIRRCVCCNKEYEYCPGCPKKDQPGWMVTFCSKPCKELFNIVTAYNTKRINKAAVKKYADEHNLDSKKFTGPVRKVLEEVKGVEVKKEVPKPSAPIKEVPKKVVPATPAPETKADSVVSVEASSPIVVNHNTTAVTSVKEEERHEHRQRRAKRRKNRQFGY